MTTHNETPRILSATASGELLYRAVEVMREFPDYSFRAIDVAAAPSPTLTAHIAPYANNVGILRPAATERLQHINYPLPDGLPGAVSIVATNTYAGYEQAAANPTGMPFNRETRRAASSIAGFIGTLSLATTRAGIFLRHPTFNKDTYAKGYIHGHITSIEDLNRFEASLMVGADITDKYSDATLSGKPLLRYTALIEHESCKLTAALYGLSAAP